jgi:flagella basal body P-ring formation protein FlgA
MKIIIKSCVFLLPMLLLVLSPVQAKDGHVVKESEVRQVIADYLRQRTNGLGVEVNIKSIGYRGDLALPDGNVEYEVVAPRQWEGWGSASLALIVRVDGQVRKNATVRVEVEALSEMVVTTRQLERGEVVSPADVSLKKLDLSAAGGKLCRSVDEVVGKRLKGTVKGNMPLRSDQVEKVPLVKSGQQVVILAESDLMRITTSGRAKGAGAAGELVMVQNLTSQKDIVARVVDSSTVRVEF